jgi:hypothetical protein
MDLLIRMGDVQVAFGILTHCFMQHLSYLLQCTLPSSTFIESLISFDPSLFQAFRHLLRPRSFDNPKGPFARKQASLSITFNGIEFKSTATITSTNYLKNWALLTSVIAVRYMVDQHPFLLEALTQFDNNTFPFQQHLRVVCDILPPLAHACLLPFEQFIEQ